MIQDSIRLHDLPVKLSSSERCCISVFPLTKISTVVLETQGGIILEN